MAELDERLSRLLSDGDSMKQVIELASAFMAGQNGSSSQTQEQPKNPNLDFIKNTFEASEQTSVERENADATSSGSDLLSILPLLLQAFSGDTSRLQSDRVNLIRAMQPYMSQNKAGNIERAMRMASLTIVAKDVLKRLGRWCEIYNQYFSQEPNHSTTQKSINFTQLEDPNQFSFEDVPTQNSENNQKETGRLRGLLGDSIKLPEFDADTVLLLVLVYFLVAEEDSSHLSDTILIIGILLLIGF